MEGKGKGSPERELGSAAGKPQYPKSPMNVRLATSADCGSIAVLHAASWRFAYRGALSDAYLAGDLAADRRSDWAARFAAPEANRHVVVAEVGDGLAGFACGYAGESEEWGSLLDNLHVSPAVQRQGTGTALLHAVAELCYEAVGQGGMYLWVLQSNVAAQRFYLRHGAEIVGSDLWKAPDGGSVPSFRMAWSSLLPLLADAPTVAES